MTDDAAPAAPKKKRRRRAKQWVHEPMLGFRLKEELYTRVTRLKLPPSEEQRERRKASARKARAIKRELDRPNYREKVAHQNAMCCTLELILRKCVTVPERPGCLIWRGPWRAKRTAPFPMMTYGEVGQMNARRAIWIAREKTGLVNRNYVMPSCGYPDCLSEEHLYLTNATQERARKHAPQYLPPQEP